jgi:hypothetical protein
MQGRTPIPIALLGAVVVSGLVASARASSVEGDIGVGAEFQLSGLGGPSVSYDGGKYHVGGFFGFSDGGGDDDTDVSIGGRFFYHVHSTAMSDFGLGGSLGIGFIGDRSDEIDESQNGLYFEPGAQIRAFLCENIALSFTAGISVAAGDAEGTAITGQTTGAGGVHYYFK